MSGVYFLPNANYQLLWKQMQLPLYTYFIAFSFFTGLTLYFQKSVPLYLKLFPVYLLITLLVELFATLLIIQSANNILLYNIYCIVNFCFLFFVLEEVITSRLMKRITLFATGIFILLALINLFFIQKSNVWNSISYSFGSLMVVALTIYYYLELFRRPKSVNLIREPAFWICAGLLFFYSCSFPFLGLNNFLDHAPLVIKLNLGSILMLLNILLYSLFTIAFLCRFKIRKISWHYFWLFILSGTIRFAIFTFNG